MKRVFSVLKIKAVDDNQNDKRRFTGIATTPTPDRVDDVVEPKGAEYKLPLPFLWQHDPSAPIGWITRANVSDAGIEIEGDVADVSEPGRLKDRIDEAWQMLKKGLVKGLSIGFNALEYADIAGTRWGQHILKWEWLELSAVTIPANLEATITTVKAAFGHKNTPGVTGQKGKATTMKTLYEQLAELKAARATKAARANEISDAITQKTATPEDAAEFDTIVEEVQQLDNDIRVKTAECINATTATPVVPSAYQGGAPAYVPKPTDQPEKFKGQNFTRMIIAKAIGAMEGVSPVAVAQKRWGKTAPTVVQLMKAAMEGGSGISGEWGADLVAADTRYTGDFIEYLKSKTVYDKLPLREVPANVQIKGQDGTATGYWVGETTAIPVSEQAFSATNLTALKVGAIAVVSNELLRDSTPAAEALVRDALADASGQRVDATFVSADAAASGVSPAGILVGTTSHSASGTDADALRADIKTLYSGFITAKNASGLYIVMNPALAKSIQMLYNALGNPEFPDITQNGGTLLGDPVVTGDNVESDDMILLKPSDIYKIGDLGIQVSISREATIEMDSAPAMESKTPTTASGAIVGMFQTENTAIKVVRPINFQIRRTATSVCDYITDAAYDNSSS